MHSSKDPVFAALWENDGSTLSTSERNLTSPHSPFFEPKLRILWTQQHLWIYNAVLAALLLLIWISRCIAALKNRRQTIEDHVVQDELLDGTASDSSSTLTGTATPPDVKNSHGADNEDSPLLSRPIRNRKAALWCTFSRRVQAFLMYQPRPLPIVNKVLPDNGTTLFVLGFITLTAALMVVNIPFEARMIFVFGDRCGALFVANLPLLYLLAAKNQPLKYLTGFSYEAVNIFHRRLGEMMCFLAFLHMTSTFYIYFALLRPLLGINLIHFLTNKLVLCGLAAFVCYETLYFTSLGSFRQRWYELFLASHVFLQAGGLGFLWFHYFTSEIYVAVSAAIFVVDRILYRLVFKSTTMRADLQLLEGETVLLSADWAITGKRPWIVGRRSIRHGWQPAEHVFITVPALSKSAVLQAHPFTIASAAPDMTAANPYAWLSLLIRAHDGFSRDLLRYAQANTSVDVRVDGPYGSMEPFHMLQAADHAVVVAGGSGIAVVFPLLWALLHPPQADILTEDDAIFSKQLGRTKRKVSLIWVIHSQAHASWLPQDLLDELSDRGLNVQVPPATATHGRPDLRAMVENLVDEDRSLTKGVRRTGVVVSGPDALNRDVRNTCSRLVRRGANINVTVEKFGW